MAKQIKASEARAMADTVNQKDIDYVYEKIASEALKGEYECTIAVTRHDYDRFVKQLKDDGFEAGQGECVAGYIQISWYR